MKCKTAVLKVQFCDSFKISIYSHCHEKCFQRNCIFLTTQYARALTQFKSFINFVFITITMDSYLNSKTGGIFFCSVAISLSLLLSLSVSVCVSLSVSLFLSLSLSLTISLNHSCSLQKQKMSLETKCKK